VASEASCRRYRPNVMPADPYQAPWPDVREFVGRELVEYLDTAADTATHGLPTRCPPWTVHDITAHLAATFERFNRMLARGRSGDLSPPFLRDELSDENLRAVRAFRGDPLVRLEEEARAFVSSGSDPTEVMPHQFGLIPVGLQMLFGLNELAVHHDDIAHATGTLYRPGADVVEALALVWNRALDGLPAARDPWIGILRASGRAFA
jgi:uncharacterized protein (TIGR03083 family)